MRKCPSEGTARTDTAGIVRNFDLQCNDVIRQEWGNPSFGYLTACDEMEVIIMMVK